jgi:hypothetical protein
MKKEGCHERFLKNVEMIGMTRIQSSGKRWRADYRENGVLGLQDTRKETCKCQSKHGSYEYSGSCSISDYIDIMKEKELIRMNKIPWSPPDSLLKIVDIYQEKDYLRLTIQSLHHSHFCPKCHHNSSRRHSRYTRLVQDLPLTDQPVKLLLISNKWFCDRIDCPVKVFSERYNWLSPNGRRTLRAEEVLRKIAFSTSCLAGEKVARAMHLPVSHDILLTIIHNTPINTEVSPFCRN